MIIEPQSRCTRIALRVRQKPTGNPELVQKPLAREGTAATHCCHCWVPGRCPARVWSGGCRMLFNASEGEITWAAAAAPRGSSPASPSGEFWCGMDGVHGKNHLGLEIKCSPRGSSLDLLEQGRTGPQGSQVVHPPGHLCPCPAGLPTSCSFQQPEDEERFTGCLCQRSQCASQTPAKP